MRHGVDDFAGQLDDMPSDLVQISDIDRRVEDPVLLVDEKRNAPALLVRNAP
jgi:hypothetical protein